MATARYLRDKITGVGLSCRLNDLSCTVVMERPLDEKLVKRWQLACEEDIAHVVVMPNVTPTKVDNLWKNSSSVSRSMAESSLFEQALP